MHLEVILDNMIQHSRSLFDRTYCYSTGGNISHRLGDAFWITATNTSFGRLVRSDFVACDLDGRPVDAAAAKPSKEASFHAAIYRERSTVQAILHLHSPAAIALSCIAVPTETGNVLPVVTSGSVTRVGRLPLIEYHPPGSNELCRRVAEACRGVNAVLMQNHGLITFAGSMDLAVDIAEECEQNIKVWLMSGGAARVLTDAELARSKPLDGAAVAPGDQQPRLRPGVKAGGWA